MGIGLGPDSYAIIEQGRIGQILNSKPMDRRAIIEEAAGITMYKTKRRLAEAKLEASKINLSRVNDILVEVEKQLASLKRQASKARRYAELREQMRGLLRSRARQQGRAPRYRSRAPGKSSARNGRGRRARSALRARTRIRAGAPERAHLRTRRRTAPDAEPARPDRARSRPRRKSHHLQSRTGGADSNRAPCASPSKSSRPSARRPISPRGLTAQRESVAALRGQTAALEAGLARIDRASLPRAPPNRSSSKRAWKSCASSPARLVEESAREQAESLQAEEAAARHTAAEEQRARGDARDRKRIRCARSRASTAADPLFPGRPSTPQELGAAVRDAQARLVELRRAQQETSQQLEQTRQTFPPSARATPRSSRFSASAPTPPTRSRNFSTPMAMRESRGFRAVGLLADYAEVQEEYEGAVEQFLREELEYVVVESFDHARAGVALLRDEMGGRATFFVDSAAHSRRRQDAKSSASMPGDFIARLDRLVEFREPLGPATKYFLKKLRTAYHRRNAAVAERMAHENPHSYFLTLDGTCYHGRTGFRRTQGRSRPARAQARTSPARNGSGAARPHRARAAGGA